MEGGCRSSPTRSVPSSSSSSCCARSGCVPVPRVYHPRLPIVLGIIGLLELTSYAGDHHVSSTAWAWVLGTMLVGALGLGALRGLSMRVWATNGWVRPPGQCRDHGPVAGVGAGALRRRHRAAPTRARAGLEGASFLLYLGLTLGVQYYVVYRRALPLWAQLGPDAGRPLQVHFTQGPGAFFATFRSGGAGPPGWVPSPRPDAGTRRPQRDRRGGRRGRRRPRPARAARAALIVPTLGVRDGAPQLQPAALRRPARLDRALARPPRRLGRLGRGRVLRAGRGPG